MKKFLAKYWIALFALILFGAAAYVIFMLYKPEKAEYETNDRLLDTQISNVQAQINDNRQYAGVQDVLEGEEKALDESRLALYKAFPGEMKEEDQILYILYLEELFGNDITFSFGTESDVITLNDGSDLKVLTLTVNYETNYQGFKDMIDRLATDDTYITSVQYCTLSYDSETDTATGTVTLVRYLLDYGQEYQSPDVDGPGGGGGTICD